MQYNEALGLEERLRFWNGSDLGSDLKCKFHKVTSILPSVVSPVPKTVSDSEKVLYEYLPKLNEIRTPPDQLPFGKYQISVFTLLCLHFSSVKEK